MKLYMIRHGYTKGNAEKRYVGVTDEPLSEEGRKHLEALKKKLFDVKPDIFLVSPMKRCRETMELLYPSETYKVVEEFRECDFGSFEYKNYQELSGDSRYQSWIDSGGTEAFPEGESPEEFRNRCRSAFVSELDKITKAAKSKKVETVMMVVHGGTIMAILDAFSSPHRDYFEWQIGNGNGYAGEIVDAQYGILSIEKLLG